MGAFVNTQQDTLKIYVFYAALIQKYEKHIEL